jgi:Uma2 family endonuclease
LDGRSRLDERHRNKTRLALMIVGAEAIEAPLTAEQLARRWQALCADPTFEDIAGKIELTEWGEILMSPVGKSHGLAAMRVAETLKKALGGHTMAEVGIATSIGVRAPDVAWCSETYLAAHPEEMPLSRAPEICVEIASASNALPKLREKAMAYIEAGAIEAWIVHPKSRQVEIYGPAGRMEVTTFGVDTTALST